MPRLSIVLGRDIIECRDSSSKSFDSNNILNVFSRHKVCVHYTLFFTTRLRNSEIFNACLIQGTKYLVLSVIKITQGEVRCTCECVYIYNRLNNNNYIPVTIWKMSTDNKLHQSTSIY